MRKARVILAGLLTTVMVIGTVPFPAFAEAGGEVNVSMEGSGTSADPYEITNRTDLENTEASKYYILMNDIDLGGIDEDGNGINEVGKRWEPLTGKSEIHLNGDGHTIRGLYINATSLQSGTYSGLFSGLYRGSIENLTLEGLIDGEGDYAGAFVGGWFRDNESAKLENCVGKVKINGSFSGAAGGLVGNVYSNAVIRKCYNLADVNNTYTPASDNPNVGTGGIVGDGPACVYDCYNTGAISAKYGYVGGVAGKAQSGKVYRSYNYGSVTHTGNSAAADNAIGGVVGFINPDNIVCNYYLSETAGTGVGKYTDSTSTDDTATTAKSLSVSDFAEAYKFGNSSIDDGEWDFEDTWTMSSTLNRPVLKSNKELAGVKQLYIGNTDINAAAGNTVNGDSGTAKLTFDNGNPILTLDNFKFTHTGSSWDGESKAAICYKGDLPLTVVLKGENVISQSGDEETCAGIYSFGKLIFSDESDGSLNVSGGSGTGVIRSYGIYLNDGMSVNGGTITAEGKEGTGNVISEGINYANGGTENIEISAGKLTCKSGNVNNYSTGIRVYATADIRITGGEVNAIAGNSEDYASSGISSAGKIYIEGGKVTAEAGEGAQSYGISSTYYDYDNNEPTDVVIITGGTVTVKTGEREESYGMFLPVGFAKIGSNIEAVTVTGYTKAVYVYQELLKTSIAGSGWEYADGSGTIYEIPASNTGQNVSNYKKIIFPAAVGSWSALKTALENGDKFVIASDITADSTDGMLVIPEGETRVLDLNGHTLDRNLSSSTDDGSVIKVAGTLRIIDSSSEGGGKITGGFNAKGGGIYVDSTGTLTVEAGSISGNNAEEGSGIYAENGGKVTINGGEITGNDCTKKSGAVVAADLTVDGNTKIYGNTFDETTAANVWVPNGKKIAVGSLSSAAKIGVSTEAEPTAGNPLVFTSGEASGAKSYFLSDDDDLSVVVSDKELALLKEASEDETPMVPLIGEIGEDFVSLANEGDFESRLTKADGTVIYDWKQVSKFTKLDPDSEYIIYLREKGSTGEGISINVKTNKEGVTTEVKNKTEQKAGETGFVVTETGVDSDAPSASIDNLNPEFVRNNIADANELDLVKDGSTLLVQLFVRNANSDENRKKIEEAAKKKNLGSGIASVFSMSLIKTLIQTSGTSETDIDKLENGVDVAIPIPTDDELKAEAFGETEETRSANIQAFATASGKTFKIAVQTGDNTEIIDPKIEGGNIIFKARNFKDSVYALLYSESEEQADSQSANERILVVKNKSDITHLFKKYGETGYKYRFKVENKAQRSIMTVSKKGRVKVKRVGTATVALFRKVKGGSWSKIEEQTLTAEKPNLPKKVTSLKVGDKVYATSFITNTMVSKPTSYESSKPSVASIDSSGLITIHKSGTTKISIIYGSGKGAAKYKVKLKIQ